MDAGWSIFLLVTMAIMLFFIWRFLNETKRIQEKMKGMRSFSDIIDATNQALDEFTSAFDEAGRVIEKRRAELMKLVGDAEDAIGRLNLLLDKIPEEKTIAPGNSGDGSRMDSRSSSREPEEERVELIKRHLEKGMAYEEISKLTGASIREIKLVEKFSGGL